MQWHEAKRSMKRDQRWEVTKMLDHEEREQLFQDHVLELANKKRLHFRKLLEETAQVSSSQAPLHDRQEFKVQSVDHLGHAMEEGKKADQGGYEI